MCSTVVFLEPSKCPQLAPDGPGVAPAESDVRNVGASDAGGGAIAQRAQRLRCEARPLATEHVENLVARMMAVALTAAEIVEGCEAFLPGVRDLAQRAADDCRARALTLEMLSRP